MTGIVPTPRDICQPGEPASPASRATLEAPVERAGVGLHTGRPCRARLDPAPCGHGWTLNGAPLAALALADATLATTLATPTGPVATVEHLLAALAGRRIDDVAITIHGGEVPLLDGSAAPWAVALTARPHGGARDPLTLTAPIEVHDGDRHLIATPAPALHLDVTIDFPLLGRQRYAAPLTDFDRAAPARTFGFAADLQALHAAGRAHGASLDNTLAYDPHGRPLTPHRLPDEPARHKWIDLLGDLALLGRPLTAHITAHKPGHALHHRLIAALRDLSAPPRS